MGMFSESLGWGNAGSLGLPQSTSPVGGTSAMPTGTVGGGDYLESFLNFGLAALPTVLGAFVQPQQSNPTPYNEPGRNAPPQQVVVSGFNPLPLFFWGALAFGAYKLLAK